MHLLKRDNPTLTAKRSTAIFGSKKTLFHCRRGLPPPKKPAKLLPEQEVDRNQAHTINFGVLVRPDQAVVSRKIREQSQVESHRRGSPVTAEKLKSSCNYRLQTVVESSTSEPHPGQQESLSDLRPLPNCSSH